MFIVEVVSFSGSFRGTRDKISGSEHWTWRVVRSQCSSEEVMIIVVTKTTSSSLNLALV